MRGDTRADTRGDIKRRPLAAAVIALLALASFAPQFAEAQSRYRRDASSIAGGLRNQYSLAYTPANQKMDGKYRKIKVELVAPDGGPLTVLDQNGKKRKFFVYTRQGYQMPKAD
jgi:hypothetical protein